MVGAAYPEEVATAVTHGPDAIAGPVINSSRGIIYTGAGPDFAEKARAAATAVRDEINALRD